MATSDEPTSLVAWYDTAMETNEDDRRENRDRIMELSIGKVKQQAQDWAENNSSDPKEMFMLYRAYLAGAAGK
jgi:hypothetical protein